MVNISNASVVEAGQFLVFDLSLLEAPPAGQSLTVALEAVGLTAQEGPSQNFDGNSGNPVDFANNEFEFSLDDGETWQRAENGNEITFGFGLTLLKVRLPVNDDGLDEGPDPELIELRVKDVVLGTVDLSDLTDTGIGSIIDDDSSDPPDITISDTVTNESEEFAVFDVNLSSPSTEKIVLQLEAEGKTAKAGIKAEFKDIKKLLTDVLEKNELKDIKKETKKALKDIKNEEKLEKKEQKALEKEANKLERFTEKLENKEKKALEKALRKETIDFDDQNFEVSYNKGKTWNKVDKGQLEIPENTEDLQVRVALNEDNWNETNETLQLKAVSTLEGEASLTSSSLATATIVNNDPLTTGIFDQIFQAENATLSGPIILGDDPGEDDRGADGGAYVDYTNPTGDYIEWIVNVPTAGSYELSWRYQNGKNNRPLELAINGTVADPSFDFQFTGGWTSNDWDIVTSPAVSLNAGDNVIRLTAIGSSGANFDYMRVVTIAPDVIISDAIATEGTEGYLVFDVNLSTAVNETITLDLVALDGTAKGGLEDDFSIDPAGDPVDYADQEFEVSSDGGTTWQDAINGTEISFAPEATDLKVRLAVNDDDAVEGIIPESMQLAVNSVLAGTVRDATDQGRGVITDNDSSGTTTPPISLLTATDIRVDEDIFFSFDGQDGGHLDGDVDEIGFTMIDPSSNPGNPNPVGGVTGYWADKLDVTNGVLQITATSGIQFKNNNSQDNALGVGLNVPSKTASLKTTLVNLPTAPGGFAQAGLWFGQATGGGDGTSEDNYIKLVALSPNSGDYQIEALIEQGGLTTQSVRIDIPDDPASLEFELFIDPASRQVNAFYSISEGALQPLTTFSNVPDEWFSFDQAGIDPQIATRSFGGVFATSRNAGSEPVFSFEDFSVEYETSINPALNQELPFDQWNLPVNNATAITVGPDERIYVATLFGDIYAFDIDPQTRTFEQELITTIPDSEGGNRLTLGIAVDPDSTAENVILWVGHSDGSVNNGAANSAKVSRLSGPGFAVKEDVVTGLPRAIANHALNNIDFGPDGNLYLWFGGNTGAGAPNTAPSEFADRAEQPLSAALLKVDIQHYKDSKLDPSDPNYRFFDGDTSSSLASVDTDGNVIPGEFIDEFYDRKFQELGREYTEVTVFASGLRNTYDGVFHSNGQIYAPDNGLGVTGTVPAVPRLGSAGLLDADGNPVLDADGKQLLDRDLTTQFGDVAFENPGLQPDPLNLIVEGGYYGHPNPYRDEVVFKDGSFQGFNDTDTDPTNDTPIGHPHYIEPILNLGNNQSANGIIEYTSDNFFGELQGDLLITNFSSGDNINRVELSEDGLNAVTYTQDFIPNLSDPLPIAMGLNGTKLEGLVFVGQFNGGSVTVLESLGTWREDLPSLPNPLGVLDAGSAVIGDQIYMVAGKTANGPISDIYVYTPGDPIDETDDLWETLPSSLPGVAVENPAAVAYNGKLYTFGGSTGPFSGAVSQSAVYDPATGIWTNLPDLPTARGGAQAAVLNDLIYVVGGLASDGASVNTVEAFDPITGNWLSDPLVDPADLQIARDNPGVAVVDDLLYVFGGRTRNANGTTVDGGLTSMEIYDPVSDTWTFGNPLISGRRTMAVGKIDGRIQVVGGEGAPDIDGDGTPDLDINQEYNPATGVWRTLPSIPTSRHGAAFGTIGDVLYVAGGGPLPGSSFTDVTEAFTF